MAEKKSGKFDGMYIVVPRTNEGYKELFAKANGNTYPFGVPMKISEQDKIALLNQKEAVKSTGYTNPYELSKQLGISIEEVMSRMEKMGEVVTSADDIKWLNRYDLHQA